MTTSKLRVIRIKQDYYPQYFKEYRNIFLQKKTKWKNFKRWCEGGNDLIGIPSADEYVHVVFSTKKEAVNYLTSIEKTQKVVWTN